MKKAGPRRPRNTARRQSSWGPLVPTAAGAGDPRRVRALGRQGRRLHVHRKKPPRAQPPSGARAPPPPCPVQRLPSAQDLPWACGPTIRRSRTGARTALATLSPPHCPQRCCRPSPHALPPGSVSWDSASPQGSLPGAPGFGGETVGPSLSHLTCMSMAKVSLDFGCGSE